MSLNEISFEQKLSVVTNSQDSIQSLSLWILHHKSHYKRIIGIWTECFEKAKPSHRLTLFYLANDVIQHAKRKGFPQFVDFFAESLKKATLLCKDDKISSSIERVFNIWLERSIYSQELIEELRGLLSGTSAQSAIVSKIVAEFKLSELIDKIKKCGKAEQMSASKLESLVKCKVDATSGEVLNKLKDKTHGEQFSRDFDEATKCLESVISALEKEVQIRTELVEGLERSDIFYETQKEEAKTVVDAYKNFGLRVKNVWRKLEESRSSLPSPLPSPPRDAPSPTNSDDGPNLPQMDVFGPEVNALLRQVVSEESKGLNQTTSSLDQRLSNLMHSMPHVNDTQTLQTIQNTQTSQTVASNHFISANNPSVHSSQMQSISNNSVISDNNSNNYSNNHWIPNSNNDSNMSLNYSNDSMYSPLMPTPNPNHNQLLYDYNYSQPMPDMNHMNRQNNADIQHIQPLVSTRGQQIPSQLNPLSVPPSVASNLMPPFHDYSSLGQPLENFEPADMDLGNSDDEDIAANRSQTHRTIKVIETISRRNSNENDFTNSSLNSDRLYSNNNMTNSSNNNRVSYQPPFQPSLSPQHKSHTRMPVRSSHSSYHHPYPPGPGQSAPQWRPRPAVGPASHFQHNSGPMSAPPVQHNRNQHNWRQNNNRNNRKTRY